MDALSINKEPYERQREAMLSAGAQALEAGREGSERGSAAMAGRVLAQQQEGQGQIRDTMNRDIFNLEAASAEEDSRLRDVNTQLDLGVASGAQAAAAAAADARQIAISQGIQSSAQFAQQAIAMPALYQQNLGAQQSALAKTELDQGQFQNIGNIKGGSMGEEAGAGFTNLDLEAVGGMSSGEFRNFKRDLSPEQKRMLFMNNDYVSKYEQMRNPYKY
jgi:hypothetical protein